jgi:hypothetical protein
MSALTKPVIYTLAKDYARFGLAKWQADAILTHKFAGRKDWDAGITGEPREIVLHIQDGWTTGSLPYWVGVQASSTVMVQRDGSILQIIPETDGPWTNGDVQSPDRSHVGDMLDRGGNPNIWTLSIEAEGHPFDPLTPAQLNSIEWQCRDWMKRYPKITVDHVERHRFINSVTRYKCPGANDTNDYYLAITKRLAGGTTTAYAMPDVPSWLTKAELEEAIDRTLGDVIAHACRRSWTVKEKTGRFLRASLKSEKVGPDLVPDETFIGEFVFFNKAGGWVLTAFGTRVFMGHLKEQVTFA